MGRLSELRKRPFVALIDHFARRLVASEDEQGTGGGMGLGLGAVLAILASPGAFASIFLLDKYSSLMQFLRGTHFDPIRRSPVDEYFFVVLSMTITGMVMVTRWNRLFPDRRDFANLAVLPIPIRNIFLANFAALLGLALLFAIDVNCVSVFLFPLFVSMSKDSFALLLRVGVAHASSVMAASLFSFFGIFGLVGLMTLILPRRIFRPASVAVRIALVVGLLTEFYSNIFLQLFAAHAPGQANPFICWIPSYWFLGIYERLAGIATPAMAALGNQACWSLAAIVIFSTFIYAICYRRIFVRLPESFDTMGGSRPVFTIHLPARGSQWAFRSSFERACTSFVAKVLARSEQHLMFLGAYLGIGLVIVTQSLTDGNAAKTQPIPSAEHLAIPLLLAFVIISGLRFVFDVPAALDANWIFQSTSTTASPAPRLIVRRFLLLATLSWQLAILLPVAILRLGWRSGILYTASTLALTILFADLMVLRWQKIPFTCKTEVDIKQLILKMLATLFGVLVFVPGLAAIERWMLPHPVRFLGLAAALAIAWYALSLYQHASPGNPASIKFLDTPPPPFELLKLT